MKKFSIILNIVLLLVCLFFGVYANIQTQLASELKTQAEHCNAEASKQAHLARESAARADQEAAVALTAIKRAEELQKELELCRGKK